MDARTHHRLMDMVGDHELRFVAADPVGVCRLRREAEAHLCWATAAHESSDLVGAFTLAHHACVEHTTTVLWSAGLEVPPDEGERLLFRAAALLACSRPLRRAVRRADELRLLQDYLQAGDVSLRQTDAAEAIEAAELLGRHTQPVLEDRYPGMVDVRRAG